METPVNNAKIILFFDLETTGLKRDSRIMEIAWRLYQGTEIVESATHIIKINPADFDERAAQINQITRAECARGIPIGEALHAFHAAAVRATALAGHNIIRFDIPILLAEAAREPPGSTLPAQFAATIAGLHVIDTMQLVPPDAASRKLVALCRACGVAEPTHRAAEDVRACAECYFARIHGISPPAAPAPAPQTLPPASPEQAAITAALATKNVVVDAVAGSGKTTLALLAARNFCEISANSTAAILLTYNRRLMEETREKTARHGITNLRAYTFHAYAGVASGSLVRNNTQLKAALARGVRHAENVGLIIIDELQDMTPLLHRLSIGLIAANPAARVLLVGDRNQTIYEFNLATQEYIDRAEDLFGRPRESWARLTLSQSFRLTCGMAAAVNALLPAPRIAAEKPGPPPYFAALHWDGARAVATLAPLLAEFADSEILVLAPSVRSRGPHINYANELARAGREVFVPTDDSDIQPSATVAARVIVCSYHQAKGIERPAVVAFGIGASYFKYYAKDANPSLLTNAQYVALTRASRCLILVGACGDTMPLFMPADFAESYCTPVGRNRLSAAVRAVRTEPREPNTFITVLQMCRHAPDELLEELDAALSRELVRVPPIQLPRAVLARDGNADFVGDIVGTAIVWWYLRADHLAIIEANEAHAFLIAKFRSSGDQAYKKYVADFGALRAKLAIGRTRTIGNIIRAAVYCDALDSCAVRAIQINDFDWLDEATAAAAARIMEIVVGDPTGLHAEIQCDAKIRGRDARDGAPSYLQINGRIDARNAEAAKMEQCGAAMAEIEQCGAAAMAYEFKAAAETRQEHFAQVAVYMWLTGAANECGRGVRWHLYNILTGEYFIITRADSERIARAVAGLVCIKFPNFQAN